MRFLRVVLTADDTPATIKALAALTAKFQNIAFIVIYPESGNDVDAANGPARIGGSDVTRVAATAKGFPLLPGIRQGDIFPTAGLGAPYSFGELYLTGKTGDAFQLGYVTI